ncbi:acyl-coenzyme A thioesterase PaaI-like protein [Bradyrhizobium sp. USDA 3311]
MKFAEFSLFAFALARLGIERASTLSFFAEFMESASEGDLIEAETNVAKSGEFLTLLSGVLCCKGRRVLVYSGLIKRAEAGAAKKNEV